VSAFHCEIVRLAFNLVKKTWAKAGLIATRGMPCRAVNAASLGIRKISERARSCVGKCYSSQKFKRVAWRILKTCSNLALRVSGVRAGARVRASPSSGGKSEKKKSKKAKAIPFLRDASTKSQLGRTRSVMHLLCPISKHRVKNSISRLSRLKAALGSRKTDTAACKFPAFSQTSAKSQCLLPAVVL